MLGVVRADGEAWVQIPAAPVGLRVTLTNRFGVGTLTPENRAWQCAGGGTATLSCTVKSGGRFKLVQRGVPGAAPIVVSSNAILGLTVVLPVGR